MKKKILFIHHNSALGGAELSFFDLVSNLSDDIIPICAVPEGKLQQKLASEGIKTYIVPMIPLHRTKNPFSIISFFFKKRKITLQLKTIIRIENIDLSHMNCFSAAYYGQTATSILDVPSIWHERDLAQHRFLAPIMEKSASYIIAISNAVANNLKEQLGDTNKIRVIYNGIDIAKFADPTNDDIPKLPKGKPIVLMAAQFVEWKKHIDFIEVAALVKKEISGTVFLLAGDKNRPDQQKYICELENAISDLGLKDSFIWTGFVENMPGLLQNIDCVVLPADHEPFGRIVAEAMAAGKPVVSVRSGAIPEIIENNISGCLVQPGDCGAMAQNVCRILKDKDLASSIGEKGKLRISQNFTIQRTVEEFEKLMASLKCRKKARDAVE